MMDTSDVVANSGKTNISTQQVLDVGMTLRKGRERMGMSVHDVAERIKFAPRQVEALEANDFAHLPQATFLRGFVRSYARVLQLDEATLIAALPGLPTKQDVAKTQAVNVVFPAIKSLRRVNVLWLAGALGVALLLGLFVLLHQGEPTAKSADVVEPVSLPAPEAAVSAVVEADAQPVTPATPEVVSIAEPKEIPKEINERKAITEPAKDIKPSMKPAPEAASAPATTVKSSIPLEALKRRPLHLVFGESAWAEVIDGHGVVLLSRNNPRGSEKWIGGPRHEPYDISISHPAHVKLYYRGREIDLSAYAGMDVAHLKLE